MKTRNKLLAVAAGVALSLVIFNGYTQPDFMVRMAGQMWSCF